MRHTILAAGIAVTAAIFLCPTAGGGEENLAFTRLAAEAEKKGYLSLARRCLLRAGAGAEERRRIAGLPDASKLTRKKRAPLDRKYAKACRDVAARRVAAARAIRREDPEAAREAAEEALRLDRGNEKAREILGQEKVPVVGWVPAADAERLRGLSAAERRRTRGWKEAWEITSDHFRVRSNLPLARVAALRDLLEAFHERWTADWEGWLELSDPDARHEVWIFAKKAEYEGVLSAGDPQFMKGVPGQYSPALRRSAFFDVETLRTGSNATSDLTELMLHECTHQLFHEAVKGRTDRATADDAPNFWAHEGIAEFYGMHRPSGGTLAVDAKAVRGMVRTAFLKANLAAAPRLGELDEMGKKAFLAADGHTRNVHYAMAGFLCWFLAERHASGLRRLVVDLYAGKNPPGALAQIEPDLGKLDRAFRKFVR